MAGIHLTGGKTFRYITEDIANGTVIITPPNRIGFQSAEFKNDVGYNNNLPNGGRLSFFIGASTPQQPAPVTLADVIEVLQAYGLTL